MSNKDFVIYEEIQNNNKPRNSWQNKNLFTNEREMDTSKQKGVIMQSQELTKIDHNKGHHKLDIFRLECRQLDMLS